MAVNSNFCSMMRRLATIHDVTDSRQTKHGSISANVSTTRCRCG